MIVFDGVRVSRNGTTVLHDLSLTVEHQSTVALVGRSGAGKTTVLKLIIRLLEPDSGHVLVGSRDTREWDPIALRRSTGYVIQEVGLFPHMSVARNVAVVPALVGWPEEQQTARARELLALVGLDPDAFASRWPDELSGGERQRVAVARALAVDPPLLLMDEPFGALDPVTRVEMHREFRRIQARLRKTVVLVTHDMREAFALADRIGVLERGRLAAYDTPAALKVSSDPEVRQLLDSMTG